MNRSLPARPNLEHLRTQAKRLLTDLQKGDDAAARTLIEHLPAAKKMTPAQVKRAGFCLADAQSAIARQSGFGAWRALARHVAQLRALEGTWQFESLQVDGTPMPASMLGSSRLLIDGDRFRTESPEAIYEGVYTIDVEQNPASIDIEFVEGPEAGHWSYGIYALDGDTLLLCLGLTGARRPLQFATAKGSGHALERLKRSSVGRPSDVTGGTRQPAPERPASAAAIDENEFRAEITPLLQQLQGDWTPLSVVTDGSPLPASMLAFGSRTMSGNETKVVFGGQVMLHAKVRLDESRTPIGVDYLNVGRGPATVTLGILELRGDVMRVCMAPAGAPRPADFSSEKGSGRTFSEWKRQQAPA
jgi:uncharacterized protein (TIGR03067 family)